MQNFDTHPTPRGFQSHEEEARDQLRPGFLLQRESNGSGDHKTREHAHASQHL